MAKRKSTSYMSPGEQIAGVIFFVIYLVVLPFATDPLFRVLEKLLAEDACFSLKQLAVNGTDLTRIGLSGPAVGRTLNTLLDRVLDGDVPNEREALLATLKHL